MKSGILVIVAVTIFAISAYTQTSKSSPYTGYRYKGVIPGKRLPNGVKSLGGSLIGDVNADPVYEIANVEKGKMTMLWLSVSTGKDAKGVTGWKVLDVLSFPALGKSDYLFFYGDPSISCTRNGKDIPNLVGVGRIFRKRSTFRPAKLWIAELTMKKFKSQSIAGIKCEYSEP